ncbi:MAG: hypothetical protein HY660_03530 [Armatimonadetes bacterium]|nr:hypothetical protein [Armatimonadota bacterium]
MEGIKDIEKAAREQGWRVEPTRKGLQFIPPETEKQIVQWHGTPSDVRAIRNFLAALKRQGFIWPWPRR